MCVLLLSIFQMFSCSFFPPYVFFRKRTWIYQQKRKWYILLIFQFHIFVEKYTFFKRSKLNRKYTLNGIAFREIQMWKKNSRRRRRRKLLETKCRITFPVIDSVKRVTVHNFASMRWSMFIDLCFYFIFGYKCADLVVVRNSNFFPLKLHCQLRTSDIFEAIDDSMSMRFCCVK